MVLMKAPNLNLSPRQNLIIWLNEALQHGRMPASEMIESALAAGHNQSTLFRAKKQLGVISEPVGFGLDRIWYWRLPARSELDSGI
jgi:hypothetical protein